MTSKQNAASLADQKIISLAFRNLCLARELVLPNAWDAASAICLARAGAPAIATTSAGIAWAAGVHDGGGLGPGDAIAALIKIVQATDLPVTADIENGYFLDEPGLIRIIQQVLDLGVVGINVEDSNRSQLMDADAQADRIAIIRQTADRYGVSLFINARVDTAFFGSSDPAERDADSIRRAEKYIDAGADGIFVPGVTDLPTISRLAGNLSVPLNIMTGPGCPSVRDLLAAGAGRITTGMAGALACYEVIEASARELLQEGTYDRLSPALDFSSFNAAMMGAKLTSR
ncbi:isocitrate lyase/phosphoenolpyruvate mutase family protein [Arthrobacter flavus]|uniref:Isocitrate lyase/phosphoenolpyruvate mutase family protein n=1 Tax=Arthrobacter flavus TaxID=95172 RepID=A0ABW4Q967_9MICC